MRDIEVGGAKMSVIGLGTWQFYAPEWGYGSTYANEVAKPLVARALELGITLFDTAEIYGLGRSEKILGEALEGHRDEAFVATKFTPVVPVAPLVEQRAKASLKRLRTDRIDLYQLHWPNPVVSDGAAMGGMRRLLDTGLVKHAGVSNYKLGRWQAAEAALGGPILSNQVRFNLVDRRPLDELIPFAAIQGRVIIAYSPLAQGLLGGRYDANNRPSGAIRRMNPLFLPENLERAAPLIDALRSVAAEHQCKPAQIALAWVIRQPNVVAIPGASSIEQLESNAAAAEIELTDSQEAQLVAAAEAFEPVGMLDQAKGTAETLVSTIRERIGLGMKVSAVRLQNMTTQAQTFDWTNQDFLRDPYRHYRELRETNPVHFNEARGSWILTRYEDMAPVLRDHERFSAERGGPANYSTDEMPRSMLASDPPHHTRLRTLVNKAFTARTVERLRQRIQQIVDGLIDDVSDSGEMEAITDFAYPLPITVIAEMLGVPASDRDFFREQSSKIAVALGPITDMAVGMAALEGRNQLVSYFNELIPKRKGDPRDDLISAMLAAEEAGDFFSHGELLAMLLLLLVAGHETTVNLIGNGLLALLRNPDQFGRLRTDDSVERSAVEEFLRYDSAVQFTGRLVMEDVEIGGHLIKKGSAISTIVASANRDPAVFDDPDTLDIGRDPNPHLSFSAGIHYCLGAQLARLEGQIALSTLVRRLPKLKLATQDLVWRPAPILRGVEALPVTF